MSHKPASDPPPDGPTLISDSPYNPFRITEEVRKPDSLPSTLDALRAECEAHRARIVEAIRQGQERFFACSNQNFAMLLKGEKIGFLLPPFDRLYDAALALDLGEAPAFPGELQTGREAVAALDALITWCRERQEPAPANSKRKLKQPPDDAFKCYRLFLTTGWKQTLLADTLSRELDRPIDQPAVSRWLAQVKAWLEDGNVLPDLMADNAPKPKIVPMDPAKIDRFTGKEKSIRRPGTADDEELKRLIAEQQADCDS